MATAQSLAGHRPHVGVEAGVGAGLAAVGQRVVAVERPVGGLDLLRHAEQVAHRVDLHDVVHDAVGGVPPVQRVVLAAAREQVAGRDRRIDELAVELEHAVAVDGGERRPVLRGLGHERHLGDRVRPRPRDVPLEVLDLRGPVLAGGERGRSVIAVLDQQRSGEARPRVRPRPGDVDRALARIHVPARPADRACGRDQCVDDLVPPVVERRAVGQVAQPARGVEPRHQRHGRRGYRATRRRDGGARGRPRSPRCGRRAPGVGPRRGDGAYAAQVAVNRSRRARAARKRTRRMARVEHDLTDEQWAGLKAAWGGCAYCGAADRALQRDCVLADLARRALHPRQHRAGLRLVQRQQVQRRGHRLAAAQAARRAGLPAAPPRDQRRGSPWCSPERAEPEPESPGAAAP